MLRNLNLKYIFIGFVFLFVFTEGLIFFHDSNFEKKEYDAICNDIYTEKVWIDTCYLPYRQENDTLMLARMIEIAGIFVTVILIAKKTLHK